MTSFESSRPTLEPANVGSRVSEPAVAAAVLQVPPFGVHGDRPPSGNADTASRIATAADLPFVLALQKRWSNQLGFLPTAAVAEYIARDGVRLCLENGEPAGYLLTAARLRCLPSTRPLVQTAICLDAQRRRHALDLVELTAADALHGGCSMLQAWCRADIDATAFWAAAGFTAVAQRRNGNRRGHPLILFRRRLTADGDFSPLQPPARSGCRGSSTANFRLLTATDRRRLGLTAADLLD